MDTDEDLTLKSGQVFLYSWYSKVKQELKFCLETAHEWKWSRPININETGVTLQILELKHITSQVYVEVRQLGGLKKQVSTNNSFQDFDFSSTAFKY